MEGSTEGFSILADEADIDPAIALSRCFMSLVRKAGQRPSSVDILLARDVRRYACPFRRRVSQSSRTPSTQRAAANGSIQ